MSAPRVHCGDCRFFERDAASLERHLPGLAALSSAHGASRADDGLCLHHDRMLRASARCGWFSPAHGQGDPSKVEVARP